MEVSSIILCIYVFIALYAGKQFAKCCADKTCLCYKAK